MKEQHLSRRTTRSEKPLAPLAAGKPTLNFLILSCLLALPASGQTTETTTIGVRPPQESHLLASWDFNDEQLTSHEGFEPIDAKNVWLVPSWSGNAVLMQSRESAVLRYPAFDGNGNPLISVTNGAVSVWFKPSWSSANESGAGPGSDARLLELGRLTADARSGWLSLYVSPDGSIMSFAGQANGRSEVFLNATISWKEGEWYQVVLNYTPTNSALFVNGVEVATGAGVRLFPDEKALARSGLLIGGDSTGWMLANGAFDELRIFAGPLTRSRVGFGYISERLLVDLDRAASSIARRRQERALAENSGEGGGGSSPLALSAGGCPAATFDHGNALWLDLIVCPTEATLTLHNTGAGTNYFFFTRQDVAVGPWNLEAEAVGLPDTNLVSVTIPLNGRTNLFAVGGVGNDSDGDGLPDAYEALVTGTDPFDGDTGDTGIPDGFKDPDGDGWTNLDEFRSRQNPGAANVAPALTGLFKTIDANGYNLIEWTPPNAPVLSFTIDRRTNATWQSAATVPGDVFTFTDTNIPPNIPAEYRVRANFPAGSSAFVSTESTAPETTDPSYTLASAVARGAGGRLYFLSSEISDGIIGFDITRIPFPSIHPKNYIFEVTTNYPQTQFRAVTTTVTGFLPTASATNGPVLLGTSFLPYHGFYALNFRAVGKDIRLGNQISESIFYDATPYLDGRQHALDNLSFTLRAGGANEPLNFIFSGGPFSAGSSYGIFPSYAVAGFHWMKHIYTATPEVLDPYRPFEDNAIFRNFCFDATRFDSLGNPTTGIGGGNPGLISLGNWAFNFNSLTYAQSASTTIPANLLSASDSQYIYYGSTASGADLGAIGLTPDVDGLRMAVNARNYYGLPYRSIRAVQITNQPSALVYYTVQAGGLLPYLADAYYYTDTEPPVFSTVGFHFADPFIRNCPGNPLWTPVDQTNQFMVGFGKRINVAAWAKKAILNGYSDKFAYVELYFDKAYKLASDGSVTTNETGILSEYGDFFPTEPGRVALATRPDLTGGPTANAIVHVIRLQLDVNHDGVMDGRFIGPDNTTAGRPFTFWVNNDYDRGNTVDGDDFEEDDLVIADKDLIQKVPDSSFTNSFFGPTIPSMRDLEDYARLWTTGITNVLAGLPANAVVELAWRTSSSQNPTLRVFRASEVNGGTAYLTDENVAQQQLDLTLYMGLVSPTNALQLNPAGGPQVTESYIFCAASRGSGELVLRVRVGNTVLAETSAFIQTKDIKEMYERWTAGDAPAVAPFQLAGLVSDPSLPPGVPAFEYPYSPARDTNTPYILYVHGWNLEPWEKDRFAETAYKRLYWQGYQGRFGSFRWPTDYKFGSKNSWALDILDATLYPTHYDRSEFSAWRSAQTLRRLLTRQNGRYPGNVYVTAHSMGNVVTGEALRLAGNIQLVNTYVASQAAIPAHVFDGSINAPNALLNFSFDHPFLPDPSTYGPETPNIYGNWLAGNSAGVGRRVNFFNPNDYALAPDAWEWNQILKPDESPRQYFFDGFPHDNHPEYTPGGPDDDPPWDHFVYLLLDDYYPMPIAQNRYEIMSFAAEPRSKALGTVSVSTLTDNIDLTNPAEAIWPADTNPHPNNGPYGRHKWHSAQFRSTNMRQSGYWRAMLSSDGFGLQP